MIIKFWNFDFWKNCEASWTHSFFGSKNQGNTKNFSQMVKEGWQQKKA
ncbi:hypothetical protein SCRDD08_01130 [Streptococcus cristatus]|uniref:Uncharacterized protein n=1 Tax=Streptococcus cristatus TaxID=45634 RepID=A0A139N1J6_STRCR|nr:hypothetical protein SCRDD08_01130 [Streptococcus cristatus]